MGQDFALITFVQDGHSHELLSLDDAARAVAAGWVAPDTLLTVYANDGSIRVQCASDVPAIDALLRDPAPYTAPVMPPPTPVIPPKGVNEEPPIELARSSQDYLLRLSKLDGREGPAYLVRWCVQPGEAFEAGDFVCIIQTELAILRIPSPGAGSLQKKLVRTHGPVSVGTPLALLRLDWRPDKELAPDIRYFALDGPEPPAPPPATTPAEMSNTDDPASPLPRYRRRRLGCGGWIIFAIAMLAGTLFLRNWMASPDLDNARKAAVIVDNADVNAPDFRPSGDEVTRYIARRAKFFAGLNPDTMAKGELQRGGAVNGIYIRDANGAEWFWLSDGAAVGHFLEASNVSLRIPPPLSEEKERIVPLVADTSVLIWPEDTATVQVDRDGAPIHLSAGQNVTVIGLTDTAFYEITLSEAKGGGVGYIARGALDGDAASLPMNTIVDRGIAFGKRAIKKGMRLAVQAQGDPALKVNSQCKATTTLLFYYHAKEGWTHQGGASWDYRMGDSGYPTLPDGSRLYPDNGELYYAATDANGRSRGGPYDKAIIINGQEYHFRRVQLETLPNGDIGFTLNC